MPLYDFICPNSHITSHRLSFVEVEEAKTKQRDVWCKECGKRAKQHLTPTPFSFVMR